MKHFLVLEETIVVGENKIKAHFYRDWSGSTVIKLK